MGACDERGEIESRARRSHTIAGCTLLRGGCERVLSPDPLGRRNRQKRRRIRERPSGTAHATSGHECVRLRERSRMAQAHPPTPTPTLSEDVIGAHVAGARLRIGRPREIGADEERAALLLPDASAGAPVEADAVAVELGARGAQIAPRPTASEARRAAKLVRLAPE